VFVGAGTVTIGRKASSDLVLQDPLVSRTHARIIIGAQSAAIEDLGSANGVFVNGSRLSSLQRLAVGDRVEIGNQVIEVLGYSTERGDDNEPTHTSSKFIAESHPAWSEEDERISTTVAPGPRR
jgi:pSer/pThr/pTyr-binding forkhead associated (FHA) protein